MNFKHISISALVLMLLAFAGCDKIDGPFIKPLETDRYVLAEMIADAENLDHDLYQSFNTLTTNGNVKPVLVLSGNTNVLGNSDAANQLVSDLGLNTSEETALFNRVKAAKANWQTTLDAELAKKGEFELKIDAAFKTETQHFEGNLTVKSLNGYKKSLNYTIYVVEDGVSIQQNDYDHVLRLAQMNVALADEIGQGKEVSKEINFDLSSFTGNMANAKLLVFIQDVESKVVLQVAEKIILPNEDPNEVPVFYEKQKILVEDFTGSRCLNCPNGHRELSNLLNVYGEQLVGIAIHYDWFATPLPPEFPNDFRTDVGTAIGDAFVGNTAPLPQGLINRVGEGNQRYFSPSAWDAQIASLVDQTPKVGISLNAKIQGNNINANLHFKVFEPLEPISDPLKVQVLVTESGIVSPQIDGGETVEDYVHNHVLRGSLNGIWGEDLVMTMPNAQDQILNKQVSGVIQPEWNKEHLAVVVVVYNDTTKEIVQVEEQHLQ